MKSFVSILIIFALLIGLYTYYEEDYTFDIDNVLIRSQVAFYKMPEYGAINFDVKQNDNEIIKLIKNIGNTLLSIVNIPIFLGDIMFATIDGIDYMLFMNPQLLDKRGLTRHYVYDSYYKTWFVSNIYNHASYYSIDKPGEIFIYREQSGRIYFYGDE